MKKWMFLAITMLLFCVTKAQVPNGTVLWHETWNGAQDLPMDVADYEFEGTTVYGNHEISYSGGTIRYSPSSNYNVALLLDAFPRKFIVKGIPTGGSNILSLTIKSVTSYSGVYGSGSGSINHSFVVISPDNGVFVTDYSYHSSQTTICTITNEHGLEFISLEFLITNAVTAPYEQNESTIYPYFNEISLIAVEKGPEPRINPQGGSYETSQIVEITCDDNSLPIYYTLDGTEPTTNSNLYQSPLYINENTTIKAMTAKNGYENCIVEEVFTIINTSTTSTIVVDGIYYEILSMDERTVSAIGVCDNNVESITIPSVINYSGRELNVKEFSFINDNGKQLKHLAIHPLLKKFQFDNCNVENLDVKCENNAVVSIGNQYKNSKCKSIKIEGEGVTIIGSSLRYLNNLHISGSALLSDFCFCPNLTSLDLGSCSELELAGRHLYPFMLSLNGRIFLSYPWLPILPIHFQDSPIDTIIVGEKIICTGDDYGGGTPRVNALPLIDNPDRYIEFKGSIIPKGLWHDTLNYLYIPSNVTKVRMAAPKSLNELVIECGEKLETLSYYTYDHHSYYFGFLGGGEPLNSFVRSSYVKKIDFDRNTSDKIFSYDNQYPTSCEQLIFNQHVQTVTAENIHVYGDSAFVKVYQMIPLQDVSFTNETYLHVPLYVPSGTKDLYEVADNWKNFFNIIEFDWEAPKYTISATCNNPQYGSITDGGDYYYGDTVTLIASPNDGYYFKNWTENGLEVCATPIYSFVVDGDRTLTAVFDMLAPNEFTVTATCNPVGAGTIEGAGVYQNGTIVTLTAIPNNGFGFLNWTENGAVVCNTPTYTFIVNGEKNLVAYFGGLGIEENETESKISIFANANRTITIIGAEKESQVIIYNIRGQMIYKGTEKTIKMTNSGLYIVAVENKRMKVIVE